MKTYPLIGIRPVVDARLLGIREALEEKTRIMAKDSSNQPFTMQTEHLPAALSFQEASAVGKKPQDAKKNSLPNLSAPP